MNVRNKTEDAKIERRKNKAGKIFHKLMAQTQPREIWIHALAAKVGGGITYLRNILPEIARQLEDAGVRVVLLLPAPLAGVKIPKFFEVRVLPRASRNALTRFVFDQFVLPWQMWRAGAGALFCSASFAPLIKTARTVVLLRNAIYFDNNLMSRELPARRRSWRLQSLLIAAGAYTCAAIMYPSRAMRQLTETAFPSLQPRGAVNYYGVSAELQKSKVQSQKSSALSTQHSALSPKRAFLYVMTYTLQKNLNFLLRALVLAQREGLRVQLVVTSNLDDRPPACHEADWQLITEHDLIGTGYLRPVGAQYGADLRQLYEEVDACVFASFCESFGHPLVEALALDKPLICADLPYAREICGDSALYIDPNRPEDLVAIWRDWPAATKKIAPLDREAFLARFAWPEHVKRLLELLL